ncbi:uncharacterized protein Z518_05842 [Rhinocladiella mackenziei CBS 650.93]|uniref:Xylanolytic transcriptional activator regulatory domain-containing protein n=1 Tax=Rhinocladiella mackenziei CBS 650.93 TaxID=1442369 RepID=A0A0D2J7C7_9EURO|nr:uncharacterized protein Z518_05842 [Rhinocladiella mackenziei CBS 650.93]KIX04970.1 hypothetical protein Z518_05842 [Rhinocladiella mackenziei CBS 650.93]
MDPATSSHPSLNTHNVREDEMVPSSGRNFSQPLAMSGQSSQISHRYQAENNQVLEDFYLDRKQVSNLFQIFFEKFHPFLPILSQDLSPDEYHARSPLLFWMIIAIAARSHPKDVGVYTNLNPPLMKLLWTKVSGIPHSHLTIQAIVLLCMWPFSTPSMITDPSFTLISIARTACMHIGLHRPEILQDFNRIKFRVEPEHVEEAVKLWAGCFVVAESITSSEGQAPLFMAADPAVSLACEPQNTYSLPQGLHITLIIQQFLNRVNCFMMTDTRLCPRQPSVYEAGTLLASFEDDLQRLERDFQGNITETDAIWISSATLQLQSYYFLEPLLSTSRKPGLLRAYHTAVKLITQTNEAIKIDWFGQSAPRYFGQMLKLAALVVMKLVFSSYSRILDFETGKNAFDTALSIHRLMSAENNDFHARSSIFLAHLWGINQNSSRLRHDEPTLRLNTRHSASLLHDSLWIWRDFYSERAIDTEQLGRPPRVLPSIIQHSPVTVMDTPSVRGEGGRAEIGDASESSQEGAQVANISDPQHLSKGIALSDLQGLRSTTNPTTSTDPMNLPDPFDPMSAYLIPDLEDTGMFYPDWTWDAGFSLSS